MTPHLLSAILAGARDGFGIDLTPAECEEVDRLLLAIRDASDSDVRLVALGSADVRRVGAVAADRSGVRGQIGKDWRRIARALKVAK